MSRTPRPDAVDEHGRVADRLHSLAIHLLREVRVEDIRSGLSPARLSALSVLVYGGERTIGELAAAEQVTAPTMSRLVAGLEKDGYVRREPHPEDARAVRVGPTARARRVLREARTRRIRHLLGLLEPLSPDEWGALRQAVDALESCLTGR